MQKHETPLGVILKGAVAGIAGTAVLSGAMQRVPKLLEQIGKPPPRKGEASGVGGGPRSEQAVEKLAGKMGEVVFDTHLSKKERQVVGQALHWAYGVGWGSFYGVVQSTFKLPPLLHGSLLGVLMSITAATLVPAAGVVPSPRELPPQRTLLQMLYIFMFAWSTAIVFSLLSPSGRRR